MASTFANSNANWRVRTDGSANNGGGFCPYVTNAGTDYTDQAAAQTSGTTGTVTAASTTFVDASAAFTAAMIGNVMQIRAATGGSAAAVDYYTITAWSSASTVTLDRSPATTTNITAATWAVGGAFLTLSNLALTALGTLPAPATPAPLTVGNTIFVRGSGSADPGTNDYDWSGGTWTFLGNSPIIVNGVCTNLITIVGYNGRPRIAHCGNVINAGAGGGSAGWDAKHISFFRKLGTNNTPAIAYTGNNTATPLRFTDCIFDQNGFDSPEYWGIGGGFDYNEVRNTGGGTAGTSVVVGINHPGCSCVGNYIHGVRGPAVAIASSASFIATTHPVFTFNHIVNNLSDGIQVILQNASTLYNCVIVHNTIDNNGGNGIVVGTSCMSYLSCFNNIISSHTGASKFAISFADAYQVNVQLQKHPFDANCFYGNTTNFNTVSASPAWVLQANDITSSPGYVNAAAGNYKTGAAVNGKGISGLGGVAGTIGSATQLVNMGAYQGSVLSGAALGATPASIATTTAALTSQITLSAAPAASAYATSAINTARTVTITLVNAVGALLPSLTGLKWALFDQATPDILVAPSSKGTGASTNGAGVLQLIIPTTSLAVNGTGWLIVSDSDGTTTQSPASKAFSAPVIVS